MDGVLQGGPAMSDTPRTDAELIPNADLSDWGCGNSTMVRAEFARELERELDLLKRNEYICPKCLLRQDDTHPKGDF